MSQEKKKSRRSTKSKATVVEAPVPVVVEEPVAPEPEVVEVLPVAPDPEPPVSLSEVAALAEAVVAATTSAESESSSTTEDKSQRKRHVHEELKTDVDQMLNRLLADIANAKEQKNKELVTSLKSYEKILKKVRNNVRKVEPREKKAIVRTQPSGFNMPQPITAEIANFAGWQPTEQKSRTDITVALCNYVKKHGLQNPEPKKRRIILPDERLTKLLRYDAKTEPQLTYSTMQKYIGHLFAETR